MSTNKESLDSNVRATLGDLQDLKDRTEDPAVHATLDRVATIVMALGLIVWLLPEEVLESIAGVALHVAESGAAAVSAAVKEATEVTKH